MTNAKPKKWSRTCEAAKWLHKDLYEGKIDPSRDLAHVIQKRCSSYLYYTKEIFQQNNKKKIKAFIALVEIGDEALLQWVEDGKLPNAYKTIKSNVALLLYVQIWCKVTFFIFVFNFLPQAKMWEAKSHLLCTRGQPRSRQRRVRLKVEVKHAPSYCPMLR